MRLYAFYMILLKGTNIHFDFKSYAIVNNIPQRVYRNDRLKSFNVSNKFL